MVPWEEASGRTRRRHIRKAKQAVLDEIAPNQSEQLRESLFESFTLDNQNDNNIDLVLMNALTGCYNDANSWETRRQILSTMADKVNFLF